MIPTAHWSNNFKLNAPAGEESRVTDLPTTRLVYGDGTVGQASFWMPTHAQLKLLLEGRPVRLFVMGKTHAPLKVGVDGDGDMPELDTP